MPFDSLSADCSVYAGIAGIWSSEAAIAMFRIVVTKRAAEPGSVPVPISQGNTRTPGSATAMLWDSPVFVAVTADRQHRTLRLPHEDHQDAGFGGVRRQAGRMSVATQCM